MSRWFVIVLLGLLTALAPVSIDMYLPALPQIGVALGGDPVRLQATLSAFFLGFAGGQALYGPLSDRWGRKPPLYAGILLYVAASIGCAMADHMDALVFSRFLQALGACAGGVIGRAIVRDLFPPEDAPRLYASLMLVMGVAPILAPLGGGWLASHLSWRGIFWFSAALGGACLLVTLLGLRESLPPVRRTHRLALGETLLGCGRLLGEPAFRPHALAGSFGSAGMFCYISASPTILLHMYQIPVQDFGWYFGVNALGLIATAQLAARLTRRIAAGRLLQIAQTAQLGLALCLLPVAAFGWGGLWGLLAPLFLFLACQGVVAPMATALAMAEQKQQAGLASSLLGTMQFGISAVASSVLGLWHDGSPLPMAAMMLLTAGLGWLFGGGRLLGRS